MKNSGRPRRGPEALLLLVSLPAPKTSFRNAILPPSPPIHLDLLHWADLWLVSCGSTQVRSFDPMSATTWKSNQGKDMDVDHQPHRQ